MFIIVIHNHRQFGLMAKTALLYQTENSKYNIEFIENCSSKKRTEQEAELIKLANANFDNSLYKKFGRRKYKTLKDFLEQKTITESDKLIQPSIENNNYQLINKAIDYKVPIYFKKEYFLTKHDKIEINQHQIDFKFSFTLTDNELLYSLKISLDGNAINLLNRELDIISNSPAIFVINRHLYRVETLRSKMIKAFTTNETIVVPKHVINTYFKTYIKPISEHYNIEVSGFTLTDEVIKPEVKLFIKEGISQSHEIEPQFFYKDILINCNSSSTKYISRYDSSYNIHRIKRDLEFENHIIQELTRHDLRKISGALFVPNKCYYNVFSWVYSHFETLKNANIEIYKSAVLQNIYCGNYTNLIAQTKEIDWFEINGFIVFGDHQIPFVKLRKYILNNIREYPLPNGQIAYLPDELFAKYKQIFEYGKIQEDKVLVNRFHDTLIAATESKTKLLSSPEGPDFSEQIEIPTMPITLRDYQKEGFRWFMNLRKLGVGGCLADDMGLGKTIQTIALLLYHHTEKNNNKESKQNTQLQLTIFDNIDHQKNQKNPSLIVAPSSLLDNWKQEIRRFAPALKTLIYQGIQRKNSHKNFNYHDIVITSYGVVRNDIEILEKHRFEYIVLDESQLIKNSESVLFKAITELNSLYRITLTGTPIENSLKDLWSQIEFINPGYLGSLSFYTKRFVAEIEKKQNPIMVEELKTLIAPFLLRRTKSEVAKELPQKNEMVIVCEMTDEQSKLYKSELSAVRNELMKMENDQNEVNKSRIFIFKELMNLRLLANDPRIAGHSEVETSGKYATVTTHLDNLYAEKQKVLIFSSFVRHLNLYKQYCDQQGYKYVTLTGQTPTKNRQAIVNEFQNGDVPFFFISLKSGGFGLNLQAAGYVLLLDPWWNPQAENQAIDRAHRIGQDKNIFIYRYITKGTVEENIQLLQAKKSAISDELIDNNVLIKSFNINDLRKLLT
ncbi:MAG: SNF2-related protein [Salinivirgaceae bacterium]|nr:SNF2-related protein [Salinivirgaceae bacterium]